MSAPTLAGITSTIEGSSARCRAAVPSGRESIEATLPTWAPLSLTLASGFITRPARSEITVTGTVLVKLSRNSPTETATIAAMATTVARPARGRAIPEFIGSLAYPDRLKLPLEP